MRARTVIGLTATLGIARASLGQSLEWVSPVDGAWLDPARWSKGNVPDAQTEDAVVGLAGAFGVDLAGSGILQIRTLRLLNPAAVLRLRPEGAERYLTVLGPVVENNGRIEVNPGAVAGRCGIAAGADVTFDGPGEIVLNATPEDPFSATITRVTGGGHSAIIGPEQTVRGTGSVNGVIVNYGLVTADVPGRSLHVLAPDFFNYAVLSAVNGGRVELRPGIVQQNGPNARVVADGGTVELRGTTINYGRLESFNGGTFEVVSQSAVSAVLMQADVRIRAGANLRVSPNSTINNGTIVIGPGAVGFTTRLRYSTTTTMGGTGEVVLDAAPGDPTSADVFVLGEGSRLTHAAAHRLRGAGRVFTPRLRNHGFITADRPGEVLLVEMDTAENFGTLRAVDNAILQITGTMLPATGRIITEGGDVRLSGELRSQAMEGSGVGSFGVVEDAALTLDSCTFSGLFHVRPRRTLVVTGGLVNNGVFVLNADREPEPAELDLRAAVSGTGSIVLGAAPEAPERAAIVVPGSFTFLNEPGHTIAGSGRITGPFVNAGVLAPGTPDEPRGHLVRDGDYAPDPRARHRLDIVGATSDRLTVTGACDLAGELEVGAPEGLVAGVSHTLVSAAKVSGKFDAVLLPDLPARGARAQLRYTSTQVLLLVPACPADWDASGGSNSADFFAFLTDFFAGAGDFDRDGISDSADFFGFLAAFFEAC
jgi:hypothetical protein